MLKINFIVFFSFFLISQTFAETNNSQPKTFKLLKINQHTITSNIFPAKKVNALLYVFNKNEKKAILNQLINDEIAIEYAFNYLKLEDNISDEVERLAYGLKLIDKISIKEIFKKISDKNASLYYKENKQNYWHKKNFEASHILVADKNTSLKLLQQLKSSSDLKSTFYKLAEKFSKDLSAKRKGYLGHFESKIMVKPFREALEKLKIGQYTLSPVKTKFGYHIILLHNIVEEGYIPFEKVKKEIKYTLAKKMQREWYKTTLMPLKEKAKIHYFFDINKTYIKEKL